MRYRRICRRLPGSGFRERGDGMECLVKVVQELLPKVSESIAERLLASLLQNQDFWKAACGRDRFLPLADRRNLDIFKQSSSFELPQDKLACLGHMSEVGIQSPRLEQCRADYSKAAVATDASAFLVAHFEKTWAKPDQPTAEELMETITAMECPLSNLMVDLKKLESCTPADMFTEITKLLGTTVVDPLFCEMLPHFEQLLTAATKNIPPTTRTGSDFRGHYDLRTYGQRRLHVKPDCQEVAGVSLALRPADALKRREL
eukprot:s619_g7.t1